MQITAYDKMTCVSSTHFANKKNLNFEWIKEEILKEYHKKKVTNIDMTDPVTKAVINKALQNVEGMEGSL